MDAIYDCHLHTEFSADSETPVRDQLEKAISLGMTILRQTFLLIQKVYAKYGTNTLDGSV